MASCQGQGSIYIPLHSLHLSRQQLPPLSTVPTMAIDYNATLIAYVFLACFDHVSERERDVVRFVLHLLSCYDVLIGELPMTQNVALLAQIYVHELCVMAAYYRQENEGFSWDKQSDPRALLDAVVVPLTRNLAHTQHQRIVHSLDSAETVLAYPLDMLNELVTSWKSSKRNRQLAQRLHRPASSIEQKQLTESTPRSECLKELELLSSANSKQPKAQSKSKTFRLALPNLGRRMNSFGSSKDQQWESGRTDPYHVIDEAFEKELQELVEHGPEVDCLCHTGHLCFIHAKGHPSDYESGSEASSQRGFGRRLQAKLKMIMPSR
ncbi:unnamed protein product [Rhizoctonia solani]|uniref:Uncharacterized protein n=3 Tax=Rhizoctonia solani TaxID=456999 RepID=A0A8H2WNP2_9AGAM|nr:unnamed protein product [Rhizoctonia solani]CAE6404939.1 unnamed protein product [Rhizoctonia solani]